MANSFCGLLSLAIVVAVSRPTMAMLAEIDAEKLRSVWDIPIPKALNSLGFKAVGENSLEPHFLTELKSWYNDASLYYYYLAARDLSHLPDMEFVAALTKHFGGDQKFYEALKAAKATNDIILKNILVGVKDTLFTNWGHSLAKVKQVFEYLKSDFNYDSLDVDKAADKLFKDPSLNRLIFFAGGKNELQSFSRVAALLADHFTPEILSRMIESAKRTPRHDGIVDKMEKGYRSYIEKKMSSAVKNNGDVVDLVPSLHSKNAESPSAAITPASFTPVSSTISLLPTAPLMNANRQQVLVNDALNPSVKSELESGLLFEPSVAKTQPLLSRDDAVAPVKSTPALPPSNNPPSKRLLARFRRWLSALWAKLRAKLRPSS